MRATGISRTPCAEVGERKDMNPQDKNVGNLGDVLKHVAYIALCTRLAQAAPKGWIVAIDTHAYRFRAPLGQRASRDGLSPERLARDLLADAAHVEAVRRFDEWQRPALRGDDYLCSPALAVMTLPRHRTWFLWAERDPDARRQLQAEGEEYLLEPVRADASLVEDSAAAPGPMACLVDPFTFDVTSHADQELWTGVERAVRKFTGAGSPGFLLMFQYRDAPEWAPWPQLTAPGWSRHPTLRRRNGGYQLAVYATRSFRKAAQEELSPLGFVPCDDVPPTGMTSRLVMVGVDLAWGGGATGLAFFHAGENAVRTRLVRGVEKVAREVVAATQGADVALVCIDAPLRCPPTLGEGRGWEMLFQRAGRQPVLTTPEAFARSAGAKLRGLLDGAGFWDLAVDPRSFRCRALEGTLRGRFYAEVYPNPAVRAFGGHAGYKRQAGAAAPQRLAANVRVLGDVLRPLGELDLLRGDVRAAVAGFKDLEDRHDGAVSLAVGAIAAGVLRAPAEGGLYLIGGHGPTLEEGAILTPLSAGDAALLRRHDPQGGQILDLSESPFPRNGERREAEAEFTSRPPPVTPEQALVRDCEAALVRVVARAGTGKTTVALARAAAILDGTPDARVLLLTFGRAASDEMRARFERHYPRHTGRLDTRTFHGLAVECLTRSGDLPAAELLNEYGRSAVLDWFRGFHADLELPRNWGDELTRVVNSTDPSDRHPEDLLAPHGGVYDVAWRRLVAFYRAERLADFDTVLVDFEYHLRTDNQFAREARGRITHVIVDEFQDTNLPQLRALQHAAGYGVARLEPVRQVVVVGDDFQSIYGFRGAVPGIFDNVATWAFASQETLALVTSQRSTAHVIRAANRTAGRLARLDEHAALAGVAAINLRPSRPERGSSAALDPRDLDAFVRREVQDGRGVRLLAHRNSTVEEILEQLHQGGVEAALLSARPERSIGLRRLLAGLSIASNPQLASFWGVWEVCRTEGMVPAAFGVLWESWRPLSRADKVDAFRGLGALGGEIADLVREGFEVTPAGLEDAFARLRPHLPQQDHPACVGAIRSLTIALKRNPTMSLGRAIGEMTRRDFAAGGDEIPVAATTVHQFKGLEAETVVVLDDFIPPPDAGIDPESADRLRLDYVARTRARDHLRIVTSHADVAKDVTVAEGPPEGALSAGNEDTNDGAAVDEMSDWVKVGKFWLHKKTGKTQMEEPGAVGEWVRDGDWEVNQRTGEARKVDPPRALLTPLPQPAVAVLTTARDSGAKPRLAPRERLLSGAASAGASASAGSALGFQWKGQFREIPVGDRASILQGAPHPDLARFLAELTVALRGMPAAPVCGYGAAARAARVSSNLALFPKLGMIQRWCVRNGLFDLSAVIVNSERGVPGGGHYVADTRSEEEWREYMQEAIGAVARWR